MTNNELINDLFAWERSIKPIDNNVACILNHNQYEYISKEFNKMKPQKKYNSLADLKNELPAIKDLKKPMDSRKNKKAIIFDREVYTKELAKKIIRDMANMVLTGERPK